MSSAAPPSANDPHRPLRIVINGAHAKSGGGVTYLRRMLPELAREPGVEIRLILHENQRALFEPVPDGVQILAFEFNPGFLSTLVWEQFSLPGIARRAGADVLFSPANFGPVFARNHVLLLRNATSVIRLTRRLKPLVYWLMLSAATLASLLTARRAIAVSDYAARVLTFGLRSVLGKKISVVYHGTAPVERRRAADALSGNSLLAVSDIYIQKNYHTLIRAFAIVRKSHPDLGLTIVGREIDRQYADSLRSLVSDLGLEDSVRFTGHVETAELDALYRDCRVFVFPSTVETFGNPLLEAMAAGAPIAASKAAAMPEVLGEGGVMFDPGDAGDMAAKIEQLLTDPELCRTLGQIAVKRAQSFTWPETARQTLGVLRQAAGHGAKTRG
jgi:glycosyltransferase involved in cell wall biosynthesis